MLLSGLPYQDQLPQLFLPLQELDLPDLLLPRLHTCCFSTPCLDVTPFLHLVKTILPRGSEMIP